MGHAAVHLGSLQFVDVGRLLVPVVGFCTARCYGQEYRPQLWSFAAVDRHSVRTRIGRVSSSHRWNVMQRTDCFDLRADSMLGIDTACRCSLVQLVGVHHCRSLLWSPARCAAMHTGIPLLRSVGQPVAVQACRSLLRSSRFGESI